MRLALHTVICCCLFITVLPLSATEEVNTSLKKRLKVWLQSHMKRDLSSSLVTGNEWDSVIHAGPKEDKNEKTMSPASSFGLNIRPRRSVSSGCKLGTCVYHDLLHELYRINTKPKDAKAPEIKISSNGYGRRRRSLLDATQLALQTGRQSESSDAVQRLCRHKHTCTVA